MEANVEGHEERNRIVLDLVRQIYHHMMTHFYRCCLRPLSLTHSQPCKYSYLFPLCFHGSSEFPSFRAFRCPKCLKFETTFFAYLHFQSCRSSSVGRKFHQTDQASCTSVHCTIQHINERFLMHLCPYVFVLCCWMTCHAHRSLIPTKRPITTITMQVIPFNLLSYQIKHFPIFLRNFHPGNIATQTKNLQSADDIFLLKNI